MIRKIGYIFLGLCWSHMAIAQADIASVKEKIASACPKKWEGIYSPIIVKDSMIDIWQGDLVDKAAFVTYANEFLIDETGQSLIKSYGDVITIMTECSTQRLNLYKTMRESTTASIDHLVTRLDGYTMFRESAIATGVSYDTQLEGITQTDTVEENIENLAIGRYTVQSGTSNDTLDNEFEDGAGDVEVEVEGEWESEELHGEEEDTLKYNGYAARAVDMNTDGNFANGSVTHTGITNQPYWQVDLDAKAPLKEILIYNRTDCCSSRLKDFYVIVSDKPINKRKLSDVLVLPDASHFHVAGPVNGSYKLDLPANTVARYVRIQLAANKTVLSLAEVEVMGSPVR